MTTPTYKASANKRMRLRRRANVQMMATRTALQTTTAATLPIQGIRLRTTGFNSTPPRANTRIVDRTSSACRTQKRIRASLKLNRDLTAMVLLASSGIRIHYVRVRLRIDPDLGRLNSFQHKQKSPGCQALLFLLKEWRAMLARHARSIQPITKAVLLRGDTGRNRTGTGTTSGLRSCHALGARTCTDY
jgi:hypothetical protein